MAPAFSQGDIVVIRGDGPLSIGDVVVARHPFRSDVLVVKRIAAIDGERYDLRGDNPAESTDSRTLGWFRQERILGRVVGTGRSEG